MELLLNDLAFHGQFQDVGALKIALDQFMEMRALARTFDREMYVPSEIAIRRVNEKMSLLEAVHELPKDERRATLAWFNKRGPFWEDVAEHGPDHWLECCGEIVTGTAVGEAAYCVTVGIDRRLISVKPSDWTYSPVTVDTVPCIHGAIRVLNYWDPEDLQHALQCNSAPATKWGDMEREARTKFQRLTLSRDCFGYLKGHPFDPGAAKRILSRLDVLDQLMGSVDDSGRRTPEWHRLYRDHFTGERARFSDSSATEKNKYRDRLTFHHPDQPGEVLFCGWHAKINNPPYRIHFSWPKLAGEPLYVVYVGWKITI